MNLQVIASPDGTILWVWGALPGSIHDTAAARIWSILAALHEAGLIALGDKGYHGIGTEVITPYRAGQTRVAEVRQPRAALRDPVERANAQLKSLRVLRKLRCSPHRAGRLAKAIHVLQGRELTAG